MVLDFLKILKVIEELRLDVFTTASLAERLNVSSSSIQNYLETLANNELIKRIEKGKYCRIYIDDKFVIGSHLVEGGVVSYQSALAFHGIDIDIPGEVFISSPLQKSSKIVFGNKISFIRIRPHKEFGALDIQGPEGSFRVTDTEKTVLDCLDLPKYVRSYGKLLKNLVYIPIDQDKMIDYGIRMQNLSILKRMAFLFDKILPGKYDDFQREVAARLNLKYTLLDPGGPDTGPFSAKWKIRNNMQFEL
jgi:predicted transcriptional regulator of viral defense system